MNNTKTLIDEITPEMKGRFLVTTQGSEHYWNTEEGFYIRNPKRDDAGRGFHASFNNTEQYWAAVENWPKVGHCFLTILTGPNPWHRSSTIKSIEVL